MNLKNLENAQPREPISIIYPPGRPEDLKLVFLQSPSMPSNIYYYSPEYYTWRQNKHKEFKTDLVGHLLCRRRIILYLSLHYPEEKFTGDDVEKCYQIYLTIGQKANYYAIEEDTYCFVAYDKSLFTGELSIEDSRKSLLQTL